MKVRGDLVKTRVVPLAKKRRIVPRGCMDITEFRESLKSAAPPAGLTAALEGLWWDGKGDWTRAHESAQRDEGPDGSWVHAYLDRKEGDLSNAQYWYRRAQRAVGQTSLDGEWESIVSWLLRAGV